VRALVALAALLVGAIPAHADTTAQNLAKYHRLRARLAEFVSVGTAPGQSEPAPERTDGAGLMKWGDGTIALGFYLGVLATEHHMLAHPEQFPGAGDPSQLATTDEELYDALFALERLDLVADAAFPDPCSTTPALNGFFVRDDVPADFAGHFPGITTIQSDFIDPTLTNKEESQDQVYHVQHGLALVVALVPASVVVHGKALRAWAIEQAQRITSHVAQGDWVIRNPACGNRAVNRGSSAIGYSYGETLAAAFVTDGAFTPTTDALWATVWDTLREPANPTYGNESNLHMALAIMAVGDGYGPDTPQVIATLAATQDWPLYPLLHRVLHPDAAGFCTTAPAVNARARAMLDELPSDGEPACPGTSGPAPHGFTTHNRFIRGKAQAYVGPPGCEGIRYHGLDYMLLHNLYAIATPGTWNGSPDADPCAPVTTDDPATTGPDAGTPGSGDAGTDPVTAPAGCGCRSSDGAPAWALFAIVGALSRRRARRPRAAACRPSSAGSRRAP
jgi:MYXO-CTERM domain-containing protein